MSELKACPFCGGKAKLSAHPGWVKEVHYRELWTVICTNCTAEHTMHMTCHEDAAARWNRRPLEDALNKRIAELERTVDDLRGELEQSDKVADKMRIAELEAENAKLRAALGGLLQLDTSYPLSIILEKLSAAAESLLNRYGYDGHGWELIYYAIEHSKIIHAKIEAAHEALKGGE